jgi:hypothetical protein
MYSPLTLEQLKKHYGNNKRCPTCGYYDKWNARYCSMCATRLPSIS